MSLPRIGGPPAPSARASPARSYTRAGRGAAAGGTYPSAGGCAAAARGERARASVPSPPCPRLSDLGQLPKRLVLGRAVRSDRLGESLLPKRYALPIFASDPLSSVAYATQEILIVLTLGGDGVPLPGAVAGRRRSSCC